MGQPSEPSGPTEMRELTRREEVLTATGYHPFARLTTAAPQMRAFASGDVAAWLATWSRTTVASAHGDPVAAVTLFVMLQRRGDLASARRVNVERVDHNVLRRHLPVGTIDDWDFRWTSSAPPSQPGQQRVVRLTATDDPAVAALLDRAFPETFTRPGDPMVRCWYGIRDGDRLIACGADRSRAGVGSISAVAVDPDARGQGHGAALTAVMTRELLGECDVVTLGVLTGNHVADRLYRRLGYTEASARTSANLHQ